MLLLGVLVGERKMGAGIVGGGGELWFHDCQLMERKCFWVGLLEYLFNLFFPSSFFNQLLFINTYLEFVNFL